MNPTPTDIKPRILSTAIDLIDASASVDLALSVAGFFGLNQLQAQNITKEIGLVTILWRDEALKLHLKKTEIDRMASAFEHRDLQKALKM